MPNTLLEFPMVFLPQVSLIWHLVFMFFLPPPPPSFTPPLFPKLLSLYFLIVLHLYTFATFLFTPSLSPNCVPTPTLPPYPHFRFFVHFMAIPLLPSPSPTIWYTTTLFPTPQPLGSPSHPPASACPLPPIFAFSSFYGPDPLLWSSCTTMTLIVPPNYICGSWNGFSKPYKLL